MRIEKIKLKNFRSFGDETEIILNPKLNVILGENGSGKSNLFIALKKLALFAENRGNYYPIDESEQKPLFIKSDWYLEKTDEEILIEITLKIDDFLVEDLIPKLMENHEEEDALSPLLKECLGNELIISFKNTHGSNLRLPLIKWGPLYFYNNYLSNSPSNFDPGSNEIIELNNFLNKLLNKLLKFGAIDLPVIFSQYNRPLVSLKGHEFYDDILKIFYENFKLFEDIRHKSENNEIRVKESLDGRYLAALLLGLKNNPEKRIRERFGEIQKKFKEYLPGLNLEITKSHDYVDIRIYSDGGGLEHSIDQSGTGIIEFVIFLSNLIGLEGKIFVFEEPELHLHPSAQRALSKLIKECSTKNQVFVLTHSPPFFDNENLGNNMRVKYNNFNSKIIKPNLLVFDSEEIYKLNKELSRQNKEIFFSRAVLLVEGQTELGAMPIFAKKVGENFDINNIYICPVDGKSSFPIYQKILEEFKIPYFILCDKDALSEGTVNSYSNKIVLDSNFEVFLNNKGFSQLFREARGKVGNSKPRKGTYVAERIDKDDIPKEIKETIEKVIDLSKP